jgi:hypothetical protein
MKTVCSCIVVAIVRLRLLHQTLDYYKWRGNQEQSGIYGRCIIMKTFIDFYKIFELKIQFLVMTEVVNENVLSFKQLLTTH